MSHFESMFFFTGLKGNLCSAGDCVFGDADLSTAVFSCKGEEPLDYQDRVKIDINLYITRQLFY